MARLVRISPLEWDLCLIDEKGLNMIPLERVSFFFLASFKISISSSWFIIKVRNKGQSVVNDKSCKVIKRTECRRKKRKRMEREDEKIVALKILFSFYDKLKANKQYLRPKSNFIFLCFLIMA